MKFQLTTAGYEKNITSLSISDEDGDTPLMKITYKDIATAAHEERRFIFFQMANRSSLGEDKNSKPINFNVALANNVLTISGNIANALYLIKHYHLLSESTCEKMIFTQDEPQLAMFLSKNKNFALPPEPEIEIEDEVSGNGNGLPHIEQSQKNGIVIKSRP